MKIQHTVFTLGGLSYRLAPHPDNDTFLQLTAENSDGEVVASAQIATTGEGGASVTLRATAGHPLSASVGGADGSLAYEGMA